MECIKIECKECNKFYIGQTTKQIKTHYSENLNALKIPNTYKSNQTAHAINTVPEFPRH